ncbi:MAG: hypothetical protein QNJ92_01200 [Alphaproteobacteria bacterium]|nr:hypothetical protein [Alphaproteobacteria bacterium]
MPRQTTDPKAIFLKGPHDRRFSCFPTPVMDPKVATITDDTGYKYYVVPGSPTAPADATGDAEMDFMLGLDTDPAALNLRDREIEALSRFLPSLLCGEESAVVIFAHESRRMGRKQRASIEASMRQLSMEEERHEIILRRLADWMPEPADLHEIHERATKFFVRLGFASVSPEQRLAHISALDTCVSLTLGAMAKNSNLKRSAPFLRIVNRIRQDESRHVRVCRRHLAELGVSKPEQTEAGHTVRARFVELLTPVADAFEDMGMDADKLFDTLRRRIVL